MKTVIMKAGDGVSGIGERPRPRGKRIKPQTDYTLRPARYAKGKQALSTPSTDGWKTRAGRLAERLANGRYSGREHAYIFSSSAAARFERLFALGWDASPFDGALLPPPERP